MSISGSSFSHNQAQGGDNATSTDPAEIVGAGAPEGGTLYSELGATATISCSSFRPQPGGGRQWQYRQRSGALVGEGLGGAIISGFSGNLYGPSSLTVTNCTLTQNSASGGENNSGSASVSALVGAGAGGGIAAYAGGTVNVSGSAVSGNLVRGGQNNTASGAGTVFADLGAGGGIFNYLGNFNSPSYGNLDPSVLTVSGSALSGNRAEAGLGGQADGGGIADVLSTTSPTSVNTVSISDSKITGNQASGATGSSATGDAMGGGLDLAGGGQRSIRVR